MSWAERSSAVKVGDKVAYSRRFLRSISCFTGDMPQARGKVTGLKTLSEDVVLAEVEWDLPDLPGRVNVKNLSRVTPERGVMDVD